jgi:probable F420-dependent oxidoreductase
MKLGLFSINNNVCGDPEIGAEIAIAAEAAGFDSVWTGEHVVLPDPQAPPSPAGPFTAMLDPAVALAFIAAKTTTIRLATGIIILPQRNPLVLAKELASLDVASKGRLIFGVGAGYLRPEFDALHVPFNDRGGRTEDAIAAMRAIWTMDAPAHVGPYWSFSGVQAYPHPVQRPIPVVMGGHSEPAYSRAVRLCEGWYGFGLDVERATKSLAALAQAGTQHERPTSFAPLEISVTPPPVPLTPELVDEYRALGVERLVVLPRGSATRDDLFRLIESSSAALSATQ